MKNTILTILILTCSLYSCVSDSSKEELLPDLVRAEALMYSYPDSALTILETMPEPPVSNRLQNATWSLLLVQARDKNYVKHTSDSLINVAYDYFMKQDDPGRKALVLNYEGRVNEDLGEVEKATRFYLEGCDMGVQMDDYKLRFLLSSNLGSIYLYRSFYKEALEAYTEAKDLAQKMNELGYVSTACSYLGRVYGMTERWDEAVSSYKDAIEKAEQADDKVELSRAFGELSAIYLKIGNNDSAFVYCMKDLAIKERYGLQSIAQSYLRIGSIYSQLELYDSAQFYLNKSLLVANNLYTKEAVYAELFEIAEEQGDMKSAFDNLRLFMEMRDTIQSQSSSEKIAEQQLRYNHEKLRNEKAQLAAEKDQIIKIALCIFLVLFVVIFSIVSVSQRKHLKRERNLAAQKEQLERKTILLYQNEEEIRNNKNQILVLSNDLKKSSEKEEKMKLEIEQLSEQNKHMLQDQIQQNENEEKIRNNENRIFNLMKSLEESSSKEKIYKEEIESFCEQNAQLEKKNLELQKSMQESALLRKNNELMDVYQRLSSEYEKLFEREQYLFKQLSAQYLILNELQEEPKYLQEEEWTEIEKAVRALFGNFDERLRKHLPYINDSDILFCSLIKFGFSNTVISILLSVQPPAIIKRKQRLKKQLPGELRMQLNKIHSFEQWLMRL